MATLNNKKRKIKLRDKTIDQLWSLAFFLPWLIGFLVFFVTPFITTIYYSFNKIEFGAQGGLVFQRNGGQNYRALFNNQIIELDGKKHTFTEFLLSSLADTALMLPLITVFSLLIAVLLNQKFNGRGVARTIFFLPIIFALPGVYTSFAGGGAASVTMLADSFFYRFFDIKQLFATSEIPGSILGFTQKAVTGVFDILMLSGVQILIFLAAIQSINPALYEVAEIEGATKYEQFFKITIPAIFPILSSVIIYTLIDLLYRSKLTILIIDHKNQFSIETKAVISVIFTLVTLGMLFIIMILLKVMQRGGSNGHKRTR